MIRIIERCLVVIGIGHSLLGLVLYRAPLAAIAGDGFVATVLPAHVDRQAAFWFVLFGPILVMLGQIVGRAARRDDAGIVRVVGLWLLAAGIVGVVMMPLSGFWTLIAVGILAVRAASRPPLTSVAAVGPAH
jgi:Family of unknown function (DUF6463)